MMIDDDYLQIPVPTAFLVDMEFEVLLKYGQYVDISAYYMHLVYLYKQTGLHDIAKSLIVIDVSSYDVEEIRKAIDSTGYVRHFIDRESINYIEWKIGTLDQQLTELLEKELYESAVLTRDEITELKSKLISTNASHDQLP